jgi:hypothetical protein
VPHPQALARRGRGIVGLTARFRKMSGQVLDFLY